MGIRERADRAAEMPHRKQFTDQLDARLESTIGRFYLQGLISEAEYDAALTYGRIVLDYLRSIEAPAPYGADSAELEDEVCLRRKILCSQAREVLKQAAQVVGVPPARIIASVDRLTVYGEAPRNKQESEYLRIGLRALARGSNVVPFELRVARGAPSFPGVRSRI